MELLLYITSDTTEEVKTELSQVVQTLYDSRQWSRRPPEFVDERDDADADEPLATIGISLSLSKPGDIEQETRELADLTHLLDAVKAFSKRHGLEFELELDGVFVGDVQRGMISRTLQVGLLDPWQERTHSHEG